MSLCDLAAIKIDPEQANHLSKSFHNVLMLFEYLQEFKGSADAPSEVGFSVSNNALREDLPDNSLPRKDVLHNAPRKNLEFIQVPQVFN